MNSTIEVRVPDIGDFVDVPVLEVLVRQGDVIAVDEPVVTLESEKATLDVPSTMAGRVLSIAVAPGERVRQGSLLLHLEPPGGSVAERSTVELRTAQERVPQQISGAGLKDLDAGIAQHAGPADAPNRWRIYASPSVRRLARELKVDLCAAKGSGRAGRVLAQDVHGLASRASELIAHTDAPPATAATSPSRNSNFERFGAIERQPLSRIQRISGPRLARTWSSIPHVTNFAEADVTELERFRTTVNAENSSEPKLTMLSFLVKACAATLKHYPAFNASLEGEEIVMKKYVHIGVAVDTNGGLVVPVIRDADKLGIMEIASDLTAKAAAARAGELRSTDMEGGCFTISSLGGIGSMGFTPIINAPELAILGVGTARLQPIWDGAQFSPRLMIPLALSWDHRALDGVAAARFLVHLATLLADFRRVLL